MGWLKKIALPIWSDYLHNLHDEDIRKHAPSKTEVVVYHGTSSNKLFKMIKTGQMLPVLEARSYNNSSDGIFVTTSMVMAELYAHHSSTGEEGDGSDPVILELQVPFAWIEADPDDSGIIKDEHGQDVPKEANFNQGRVLRPINIKRIKTVQINNSVLSKYSPFGSDNPFDAMKTKMLPLGKMIDLIKQVSKKEKDLPDLYSEMVKFRPRGLSRSQPHEDAEQIIAKGLMSVFQTFASPGPIGGQSQFERSLGWVYKNNMNQPATQLLPQYIEYMKPGTWKEISEHMQGTDYFPKPNESLWMYARRHGSF